MTDEHENANDDERSDDRASNEHVRVTLVDDGVGVEAGEVERVFEQVRQGQSTCTRSASYG